MRDNNYLSTKGLPTAFLDKVRIWGLFPLDMYICNDWESYRQYKSIFLNEWEIILTLNTWQEDQNMFNI